jgi:lipopolysaccharide transport system permease protein
LFAAFWIWFYVGGADIHFGNILPTDVLVDVNVDVLVNILTFVIVFVLMLVFVFMLAGLGLGFGILISSMTTKYRDLTILFSFIVQLWMYATPIVYPISMVTNETLKTIIMLNPMSSIIEAFKFLTLGQGYFSWLALGYSFTFMSVLLLFGIIIFNKVQRSFMDTV